VPGLIDGQLRAVWQADRRQAPPALVGDLPCHGDSLGSQLGEGGVDVVAHQVQLVTALAGGRMDSELGRRQGEDAPAPSDIHRRQAEFVSEERADLLGIRGEHDRVDSGDHALILTTHLVEPIGWEAPTGPAEWASTTIRWDLRKPVRR
jgi:hypothetical protein